MTVEEHLRIMIGDMVLTIAQKAAEGDVLRDEIARRDALLAQRTGDAAAQGTRAGARRGPAPVDDASKG